ncbi:hypothetical protein JOC86_003122 [Bacillus pakistanensis]|uniref:Uncharacterized protein n=1 Tax=Rossellomorea pakistanensis TaxID=992288 RepID=A0ABS2NFH2_9BACI|nr:hypothetical protein [Bacillus pakistanensis]MBM7586570.1 hypothetical protein [Bacillus pakistanensis]
MKTSKSLFNNGAKAYIKETGQEVTILKSQYVKNMKRFSYIVKEHPGTFFFEEELEAKKN